MVILMSGATGTVGREVIRALNDQASFLKGEKIQVRLLVRNEEKARSLLDQFENIQFSYVVGDLNDLEKVRVDDLFSNVERLFLLTISSPWQAKIESGFVHLAVKYCTTLKQIIRVSALGSSYDRDINCLMRWHNDSERAIQHLVDNTEVKLVILRPNLFLQNFISQDLAVIKSQGAFYRPMSDRSVPYQISHVDVRDIGDLAAVVLIEPVEKHANQTYNITGPQSLNYDQLAQIMSKAIGAEVKHVPIPEDVFANNLQQMNMPSFVMWMLVKLFQMYKVNGITANVHGDFKIVTGKEPRSAEQFFSDFKNEFIV
ncbi:hypothetical protein C9374_003195 [Naegleria lovaniensis]|uniref:NmrA-like domain-containing protein n=1 Tax=Naegleria lovaniensis TaxID=51637 RepID=A0AA88GUI2_NAELO|nr:uncharacterized protein C9374_003195 [Naegleria lovaniensis]KAG2386046.1 hypothetical protein C9374_003195 [Naegleria lovaniensis]